MFALHLQPCERSRVQIPLRPTSFFLSHSYCAPQLHAYTHPFFAMYADREEALRNSAAAAAPIDPAQRERELQEQLRRRAFESRRQPTGDSWRDRSARRRESGYERPAPYEGRYRSERAPSNESRMRAYDDSPRRGGPEVRDYRDSFRSRDRERSPREYRRSRDVYRGDSYVPRSEDDYDARSVFVSQLSLRTGERDLGEFFESHLGRDTVRAAYVVTDPTSGKSQGTGFVEFMSGAMVRRALDLTGQRMFGLPVLVQPAVAARAHSHPVVQGIVQEDLEHRIPRVATTVPQKPAAPVHVDPAARLHVGNLHFDIGAENVRDIFEPFGDVAEVDMPTEPATGRSKGYAFVQFVREQDARIAQEQLNGFDLAGRQMRVGPVNSRGGGGRRQRLMSKFDEGGGGGLSSSEQRIALMQKLSRSDDTSLQQIRPDSIPESVSASLVLRHMFDATKETEPHWMFDLRDDVRGECERFGRVVQVHVDTESTDGEVYVQFTDVAAAQRARPSLNGRFFGGSRIAAELCVGKANQCTRRDCVGEKQQHVVYFFIYINCATSNAGRHRRRPALRRVRQRVRKEGASG